MAGKVSDGLCTSPGRPSVPFALRAVMCRPTNALAHAARHEAPDKDFAVKPQRPDHRSAGPVRLGDQGVVGNIDPEPICDDCKQQMPRQMSRGGSPADTLPARTQSPQIQTAPMRDLAFHKPSGRGTTIGTLP